MQLLSIDVEEWFHLLHRSNPDTEIDWNRYPTRLESGISRITDLLASKHIRATFFCVGWVAQKYPKLIQMIDRNGHQIGSHSYLHRKIQSMTRQEFAHDLARSVNCLEQITGKKITCYRAPGFSVDKSNLYVFEELLANGIETDSSVVLSNMHAYGGFRHLSIASPFRIRVNGCTIKEFPITTKRILHRKFIFSGGGYFRFFPYRCIRHWTACSEYIMSYFHYRDFDLRQPVLENLGKLERFRSYYGIAGAFEKFNMYLDQFKFTNISNIDQAINWDEVQTIELGHMATL